MAHHVLLKKQASLKRSITCVMFNAQSIRAKLDEFQCYFALERPDIICVTETWVSEVFNGDRLQDFELQGYNMFSYCRELRQGGGLFVYVNNLYSATGVDDPSKVKTVESLWVDTKIGNGNRGGLRIGAFYRAGNLPTEHQAEADSNICDEIWKHFLPGRLIMGDFHSRGYENIAVETNECRIFRQVFEEEFFMHQFVTEPTRHSSILDLVFSDCVDLVRNVTTSEGIGKSDHNMVKFIITSDSRPKDNLLLVPNFNLADFDSIRGELTHIDWSTDLAGLDA